MSVQAAVKGGIHSISAFFQLPTSGAGQQVSHIAASPSSLLLLIQNLLGPLCAASIAYVSSYLLLRLPTELCGMPSCAVSKLLRPGHAGIWRHSVKSRIVVTGSVNPSMITHRVKHVL